MFSTKCASKLWSPSLNQVRNGARVNVQRPKQPHKRRHLMFEVTKPIYPRDERPKSEMCVKSITEEENLQSTSLYKYHEILADMVRADFDENPTAAIYQRNPINGYDFRIARSQFIKNGLLLRHFESDVMNLALQGTRYEKLLHLFCTDCVIGLGKDPEQAVAKFLQFEKKIPEFLLLGGIVENRILGKSQLQSYCQLNGIKSVQGQLSGLLASTASKLSSHLNNQQTTLSRNLDQYVKQCSET